MSSRSSRSRGNIGRTILVVAANPSNENRLRLDVEVRGIEEGLRLSRQRDQFVIEQQWTSRVRDLRRAVQNYEPTIVHFIGHGSGEQGIVLEDNDGKTRLISAEALANFFELFADTVECVVLNACFSEVQAMEIVKHIPYVIGMSRAINDKAAIEFAVGFYGALASGKDYEKAYKFGCSSIEMAGISGHLIPQLFIKSTKESYGRFHEPVLEQALSENRWEIIESFFSDLGAKLITKTKDLFWFSNINGKLSSFLPITVLISENPKKQDIRNLLFFLEEQQNKKNDRVSIVIYIEKPDTVCQMEIAKYRLENSLIIIPIPFAEVEKAFINKSSYALLAEYTEQYLPGADLFDSKNAIGDTLAFFGRQKLLYSLGEELKSNQAIGLFGMRKSGKTSILLQLGFSLPDYPVVHIDLQLYGSQEIYTAKIFNEIISKLYKLATISKFTADSVSSLDRLLLPDIRGKDVTVKFVESIEYLSQILRDKAFKLPIICFIDEIERIYPFESDCREKVEEFNAFFGTLRALSQEKHILSLLVADVHPDCNRRNHWLQSDVPTNPVYSFFQEIYVPPFIPENTYTMLSDIGGLMARAFDNETQELIHIKSGGQPFIARQLASMLCKKIKTTEGKIQYSTAEPYLNKPFIHSGVLKNYFEQNIWADLEKRKNTAAIKILQLLACNESLNNGINLETIINRLEDYSENDCLDVLDWMKNISLVSMIESDSEYYYKDTIPLLSQWVRMRMKPSDIKYWEITK